MKLYIDMFVSFFKVGLFTFGGGYAMIPIAKREIIQNRGWINEEQLLDYYGIAQVSMGIIAINTNALVGYKIGHKRGAVVAAFATALPSILIITLIAFTLEGLFDLPLVANMFKAIRIAVAALITHTTLVLAKKGIVDTFGVVLFLVSFSVMAFLHVSPIYIVIPSAFLGLLFYSKRGGKS